MRGGSPIPASPYDKGRWHEVPEGIRKSTFDKVNRKADINSQKGRHLLCSFCPYEMRSMSRKGRELCPNGAKREGKPRFSGVCRAHAVVSPLNFSADSRCFCFVSKRKATKPGLMPPLTVRGGVEQSETEGIRSSEESRQSLSHAAHASSLCTRESKYGSAFLLSIRQESE